MIYTTCDIARRYDVLGKKAYGGNASLPLYIMLYLAPVDVTIDVLGRLEVSPRGEAEQVGRRVAIECAEYVLLIYEEQVPTDRNLRSAVETMRNYVYGGVTITEEELCTIRLVSLLKFRSSLVLKLKEVLGKLLPLPDGLLVSTPYRIFGERFVAPQMLFGHGIVAKKKLKNLKVG